MANAKTVMFSVLCVIAVIPCQFFGHALNERKANIVIPEVAVPGHTTVALVHFYKNDEVENVTLRLVRCMDSANHNGLAQQTEILAQNTSLVRESGAVELAVPRQKSGIYDLQVLFNCNLSDSNCTLQASSNINLTGSIRDVIIRPSSNYYRPGETITFWVMAIDYSLQAPGSVTGNINVKNPSGIKVALWADVPLNDVDKKYEMPLSDRTPLGKWIIEVDVEYGKFSCELNISLVRGSTELPKHEQIAAEKHFVELQFSEEMRKWYKPGLPLMGKVDAVSSEKEMRVRVKVIDDQLIVLYSQDIDMTGREGTFLVPAVITNTSKVIVQAELISLGGKDVDSQYILARRILYRWNSTSQCYILIKDANSKFLPNTKAEVTVLSSCPCVNDVHYVIATDNRITSWGNVKLNNDTNSPIDVDNIMQGVNICRFNLSFVVEAEMAPLSNLLVYYSANDGDVISDKITFQVKLQQDEVSIIVDESNEWGLDEPIKCGLISRDNSHICLIGGRKEDKPVANKKTADNENDFAQTEITFLSKLGVHERYDYNYTHPIHHSFFPQNFIDQLWLWKCFTYTKDIEMNGITLPSPGISGKWMLWALSFSEELGLSVTEPSTINVFSPVTVAYQLPINLKIMEILQVEINIINNVNSCIDIHAVVNLSDGLVYPGIDSPVVSEKLRLGGNGGTSVVVRIQPTSIGHKTMTTMVTYFVRDGCQETTYMFDDVEEHSPLTNRITRIESTEAIPEGVQKIQAQDAFFCANEYIITLPENDVDFSFVQIPRKKYGVVIEVQAEKGVHIVLSEHKNASDEMYQITLGDYDNTVSWIARGKHDHEVHLISAQTPQLLSRTNKQTFCINWDRNVISVGNGNDIGSNIFLQHPMTNKFTVNFIGFATNWGVDATIIVWAFNEESGYSQVIHMDLPNPILSGTEKGTLLISAGINITKDLFPVTKMSNDYQFSSSSPGKKKHVNSIISSFTPMLLLDHSTEQHDQNPKFFQIIQQNLQVLFNYMKKDFSFSDHPSLDDYRATLNIMDILQTTQFYIEIDPYLINRINKWILNHQMEDGHFEDNINITSEEKISLTAESLVILLGMSYGPEPTKALSKSLIYLESNFQLANESYTLAVTSYALALSKSPLFENAISLLYNHSANKEDEFKFQPLSSFEWLYEDDGTSENKKTELATAYMMEYKTSLYTLMIHSLTNNLEKGKPIAQYVFSHSQILSQYPELVYITAKAIVKFAALQPPPHSSLIISLATSGMELTDTIKLDGRGSVNLNLPTLPTKVFMYATGAGCSSIQGTVTYSTYPANQRGKFNLSSVIEEQIPAHYNSINDPEGMFPTLKLKTCFNLKKSARAVHLEVSLFTGYTLLSVLSEHTNLVYGSVGYKAWFIFTGVPSNCATCIRYLVESSFTITSLRPMLARVYDINEPYIIEEVFFHENRKNSILLADLSNQNFVNWFGVVIGGHREESLQNSTDRWVLKDDQGVIIIIVPCVPLGKSKGFPRLYPDFVEMLDDGQDECSGNQREENIVNECGSEYKNTSAPRIVKSSIPSNYSQGKVDHHDQLSTLINERNLGNENGTLENRTISSSHSADECDKRNIKVCTSPTENVITSNNKTKALSSNSLAPSNTIFQANVYTITTPKQDLANLNTSETGNMVPTTPDYIKSSVGIIDLSTKLSSIYNSASLSTEQLYNTKLTTPLYSETEKTTDIPNKFDDKNSGVNGSLKNINKKVNQKGYKYKFQEVGKLGLKETQKGNKIFQRDNEKIKYTKNEKEKETPKKNITDKEKVTNKNSAQNRNSNETISNALNSTSLIEKSLIHKNKNNNEIQKTTKEVKSISKYDKEISENRYIDKDALNTKYSGENMDTERKINEETFVMNSTGMKHNTNTERKNITKINLKRKIHKSTHINTVVVGQNEIVFGSNSNSLSTSTSVDNYVTKPSVTKNKLWGMLRETGHSKSMQK